MVPATLAVGLPSGRCQVGCQAAARCCQIVKHYQALSGAVSSCCQGCQAGAQHRSFGHTEAGPLVETRFPGNDLLSCTLRCCVATARVV